MNANGWIEPTVAPALMYDDAQGASTWLRTVLDFNESFTVRDATATIRHSEWYTGRSVVMMTSTTAESMELMDGERLWLYIVVEDADVHCRHARAAGATIVRVPHDRPGGGRGYILRDPGGHIWFCATRRVTVPADITELTAHAPGLGVEPAAADSGAAGARHDGSIEPTVVPVLVYDDAADATVWLHDVLGFEESFTVRDADGTIRHSEWYVGSSVIMLTSRTPQSMTIAEGAPRWLFITVGDADSHWHKAVEAGAIVVRAPADGPGGGRGYMLRDPGGNFWSCNTRHVTVPASLPEAASTPEALAPESGTAAVWPTPEWFAEVLRSGDRLAPTQGVNVRMAYTVTGSPRGTVQFVEVIRDGKLVSIGDGEALEEDVTLTVSYEDYKRIIQGGAHSHEMPTVITGGRVDKIEQLIPIRNTAEYQQHKAYVGQITRWPDEVGLESGKSVD